MTLVEVVAALTIAAILMAALTGVLVQAFRAQAYASQSNDASRQARFAMERMSWAVRGTRQLLLPQRDKPATTWREHVREQTVPASAPEAGSVLATAVLAVTLPLDVDQDGNGIPDADNDGDRRIDEDPADDANGDAAAGVRGIDDGGDGFVDGGGSGDDDEFLFSAGEDPINGIDNDGDGNVDEDPPADANADDQPGLAGVDDDGDGQVDEGAADDDDEDGTASEDWWDTLVFFLNGSTLIERMPVPWDADASGSITGRDYVESPLAEGVTRFRVERVPLSGERAELVDIVLEIKGGEGEVVSLHTRVRVGGAP